MVEMKHPAETLCYHQHTGFHLYAPFAVTTSSTMVEMKHPAETLCYQQRHFVIISIQAFTYTLPLL